MQEQFDWQKLDDFYRRKDIPSKKNGEGNTFIPESNNYSSLPSGLTNILLGMCDISSCDVMRWICIHNPKTVYLNLYNHSTHQHLSLHICTLYVLSSPFIILRFIPG